MSKEIATVGAATAATGTSTRWMRLGMALLATALMFMALVALGAPRAEAVPFEITSLDGGLFEAPGVEETQAGSHPATGLIEFRLNRATDGVGFMKPIGTLRGTEVDLPPGLVGNPQATPACPASTGLGEKCPDDTQVGVVSLVGSPSSPTFTTSYPVYNMEAPFGTPALFKFTVNGVPVIISGRVRTESDYGISAAELNAPQTLPVFGVDFTFWGVPANPDHDADRGYNSSGLLFCGETADPSCSNPSLAPEKPFFTLPTSCTGPQVTSMRITTWEGEEDSDSFTTPGNEGCGELDFSPTIVARPTTDAADSPSGLSVDLHIPQNQAPDENAEAHLRDTVVTLPEGMTLNPSAANGLDGCSPAEVDLHGASPARCPNASKLGTVEVETPVLDHPVRGAVYLADPHDNPFGSLLALYIAIDDEESGVVVKLAGRVSSDPSSGRLTAVFVDNPQLPFEDFRLRFFGGAGGSLRTPAVCGSYSTISSLTPWSAADPSASVHPSDAFAIGRAAGGGACPTAAAALPNTPVFDAGTSRPVAGLHAPLVVNLRREDGSQQFHSLTLTPPQGLVGKLAGVPYCPDAAVAAATAKSGRVEQASPSCPAASYVGGVTAAAGAGPTPYFASGKAYLTGPYKGAPLSLAIVMPAVAGPFDLGTVVVRSALFVDRKTAQITAVSDPIPSILRVPTATGTQGIPLDVRSVQVRLDRPEFTLNPSSCDPMGFSAQLFSTLGQSTLLGSPFQVGGCKRLGFEPRMSLRLEGGTTRGKYPALTAVLRTRPGDANIARLSLALPHSEFLAQEHIRTVCTRVQFAADQCPAAAIYGTATVYSPLLDYPLSGPVYLRSSNNPLPDLVPDLRGPAAQPIKLESVGRTDSIRGGIRNTFDFIPDAPFTKLVVQMQGGKKGLLVNSRDICRHASRATVKFRAHNGRALESRPALRADCGRK